MIYRKIRIISLKRLFCAALLLFLTCSILCHVPFFDVLWPAQIDSPEGIIELYQNGISYVELKADRLYYTGYDYIENGKPAGSYYYTLQDEICTFFLLSDAQCNHRQEVLTSLSMKARLQNGGRLLSDLISRMSADLTWTPQGLSSASSRIIINSVDYLTPKDIAFWSLSLVAFIIFLLVFLNELCYTVFPILHPACTRLRRYGSVKGQIVQAEQELRKPPLLKEGIFTITEHYLITSSATQFSILPLERIIWAYKHSSLHHFRFRRLRITYTLRIVAKKKLSFAADRQPKEEVDAVLRYLSLYNPDILINYTKENENLARLHRGL